MGGHDRCHDSLVAVKVDVLFLESLQVVPGRFHLDAEELPEAVKCGLQGFPHWPLGVDTMNHKHFPGHATAPSF